jgi:hypothetical protein
MPSTSQPSKKKKKKKKVQDQRMIKRDIERKEDIRRYREPVRRRGRIPPP